nr:DUF4263 domain-containing protein [Heyndrickxia oleronia]
MDLYNGQDYKVLNDADRRELFTVQETEQNQTMFGRVNKFRQYPKAARHNLTLFPNNYLDIVELKDKDNIMNICEEYKKFLDTDPNEQELLSFINNNEYYILIAALYKFYNFGHHDAFLFKEFQIGTDFRADYILVGRGSGGYEFIFVELEHPSIKTFLKDSQDYAAPYRKGINQVNDWRRYLEKNFNTLAPVFKKALKVNDNLPSEFLENDSSRRHYIVIAGRRNHYEINQEKTYEIRRNEEKTSGIKLLHFDNLYDLAHSMINKDSY